MTTATANITLTPSMLAEAFWGMESSQQVEFFAELARVIRANHEAGNRYAYSLGELQWFYTGSQLLEEKNREARDMLMTIAAPLYLHTLRATGGL